ncbi:MAG: glycosyltransferase family 4 protein [Promethearchaeota archaeon]
MKVCYINYISPSLIHGGAEKVVLDEAKMIADSGNRVFIVSLKHAKNAPSIMYLYNRKVRNLFLPFVFYHSQSTIRKGLNVLSSLYNPILISYLKKLLVLEQPDIVHIHQIGPISVYALKMIRQLGIKSVQTFHGYYFECPKGGLYKRERRVCDYPSVFCKLYRRIYCKLLDPCDHIIAISSYVRTRLLNTGYDPNIITLLPNSISLKNPPPFETKPRRPKEILFVGRMVWVKGVHVLLRALTKIRGIKEEYIVNLIGDGEDRKMFEKLARPLPIQVNFLGRVSEKLLELHYQKAWVVVVPSLFPELCPMVPLEAASYGTPVIASNIGGMPDVARHGQTGFLFKPGDADELANYLEALLSDEELTMKFSENAILFSKNFSHEKKLEQLLKIYEKVLG